MKENLYSLWEKISKPLEILGIIITCLLAIILLIVIALAYIFNINIPGLHGKTIWDWLQLLIIPAVLAIGGYLFNYTTSRNEREAATKRNQTERDIATDNQQEAALQAYIDKISELLLERHLRESNIQDEVRTIARVRTLTTLPRLDEVRKGSIVQFLYESQLISRNGSVVRLEGADLSKADLRLADLRVADLTGANLRGADLTGADLTGADLTGAKLQDARLGHADLNGAKLQVTKLTGAYLYGANLRGADLIGADLIGANLIEADLSKADLSRARLSGQLGRGKSPEPARLSGANLSEAILDGAKVTVKQLDSAESLSGAIMPDRSKHF